MFLFKTHAVCDKALHLIIRPMLNKLMSKFHK